LPILVHITPMITVLIISVTASIFALRGHADWASEVPWSYNVPSIGLIHRLEFDWSVWRTFLRRRTILVSAKIVQVFVFFHTYFCSTQSLTFFPCERLSRTHGAVCNYVILIDTLVEIRLRPLWRQ
jgi:hypothetical protein